jgi:hypothetical protein
MATNTNPVESNTEASKSVNDTKHEGQSVHNKFTADIKSGPVDTSRMAGPSTANLHDLQIVDSSLAGAAGFAAGGLAGGVAAGFGATESAKLPSANTAEGWLSKAGNNVLHNAENKWSNLKAGIGAVEKSGSQVIKGAVQEVENHPLQIAGEAISGAALGVGLTALAPEAVVGLGLASAGYAAYELMNKAPDWMKDAKTESNPTKFSQKDMDAANKDLQSTGASSTQYLAAAIGGAGSFAYLGTGGELAGMAINETDASLAGVTGYIGGGLQHAMSKIQFGTQSHKSETPEKPAAQASREATKS